MNNKRGHGRSVLAIDGGIFRGPVIRIINNKSSGQKPVVLKWKPIENSNNRFSCRLIFCGNLAIRNITFNWLFPCRHLTGWSEEHDVFTFDQINFRLLQYLQGGLRRDFSQNRMIGNRGNHTLRNNAAPECLN